MDFLPLKKKRLSDEVKQYLVNYIRNMDVTQSTKLPTEDSIAQNLSVSRITVRKALTDLEREGLIFRIHGKGTFANAEAILIKVNINDADEFKHLIVDSGYHAKVQIGNYRTIDAGPHISKKLLINENDRVISLDKVFYADNRPAILCTNIFAESLLNEQYSTEFNGRSMFEYLRQEAGRMVIWDKVDIQVATKSELASKNLFAEILEDRAYLVFETVNFDQDNNPVLYGYEIYDTTIIHFNIIRQKKLIYNNKPVEEREGTLYNV